MQLVKKLPMHLGDLILTVGLGKAGVLFEIQFISS